MTTEKFIKFSNEIIPILTKLSSIMKIHDIPNYVRICMDDNGYIHVEGAGFDGYELYRFTKGEWEIQHTTKLKRNIDESEESINE